MAGIRHYLFQIRSGPLAVVDGWFKLFF